MSQVFKPLTASGPIPPNVPTSFIEQTGTAVPSANQLIIDGFDSIENNVNGITTKGGASAGDPPGTGATNEVSIYITNRISVTATTVDATPTTVAVLTMTNATAVTFRVLITAINVAGNTMAGGELVGIARAAAGVATVVGTNDTFDEADVALGAVDWDIVSNGALILQMQFVGIAATTISWRALFEFIQAP